MARLGNNRRRTVGRSRTWLLAGAVLIAATACGSGTAAPPPVTAAPTTPSAPEPTDVAHSTPPPTAAPTSPPQPSGLAAAGTVAFVHPLGYTYAVTVDWSSHYPVASVGSNPPGKTDIVMDPIGPYSGTFLNTTTGGRTFPFSESRSITLVGIYPADSFVCQDSDVRRLAGSVSIVAHTKAATACIFPFQKVLGFGSVGGVFDTEAVPNGETIHFTPRDAGVVRLGFRLEGVDEGLAAELIPALSAPVGIGLIGDSMKVETSGACQYTNQNWNVKEQFVYPLVGRC